MIDEWLFFVDDELLLRASGAFYLLVLYIWQLKKKLYKLEKLVNEIVFFHCHFLLSQQESSLDCCLSYFELHQPSWL